jgi:hypothetical protein
MTAIELDEWLRTRPSRGVGWKGADRKARESVGHAGGRHIVRILNSPNEDLTEGRFRPHAKGRRLHPQAQRTQRPENIYTSRCDTAS